MVKSFNSRRHKPKKVKRRHKGGGGSIRPLPSTFDNIHPIDFIFGTCNDRSVYSQLIKTTFCLIGFHCNHSNIMTSLAAAVLDFQIFNFLIFNENGEKTTLIDWNLQNCQIHCKVIII